jgi:hypothetical protein
LLLDPRIVTVRARQLRRRPARILIALGGGAHVYGLAAHLSRAIAATVAGKSFTYVRLLPMNST